MRKRTAKKKRDFLIVGAEWGKLRDIRNSVRQEDAHYAQSGSIKDCHQACSNGSETWD